MGSTPWSIGGSADILYPARQDFLRRPSKLRKLTPKHWRKPGNISENGGTSASLSPVDYRRCLLQENDCIVKIT
jgi:hypothetical protein